MRKKTEKINSNNFLTENVYKSQRGGDGKAEKTPWSSNEVLLEHEFRMNSSWVAKVQEELYENARECQVTGSDSKRDK